MVNPIQPHLANASLSRRERSPRFPVDLNAYVEANGKEMPAHLQDISSTGAALFGDVPDMSNEQFLDLHVEGYQRLQGRVVREFAGGYALQFDDENAPTISDAELEKFRKLAEVRG